MKRSSQSAAVPVAAQEPPQQPNTDQGHPAVPNVEAPAAQGAGSRSMDAVDPIAGERLADRMNGLLGQLAAKELECSRLREAVQLILVSEHSISLLKLGNLPAGQKARSIAKAVEEKNRALERAHTIANFAGADPVLTQAARDVLAERRRQIEVEGWTPEHDDEHGYGELARAAGAYALYAAAAMSEHPGVANSLHRSAAGAWPWDGPSKANASTERRMLVKAAALTLAEIERLDRAVIASSGAAPVKGGA